MRYKPIFLFTILWGMITIACRVPGTGSSQPDMDNALLKTIVAATLTRAAESGPPATRTFTVKPIEPNILIVPAETEIPVQETDPSAAETGLPNTPTPQVIPTEIPAFSINMNSPENDTAAEFTYITQSGDTFEYIAERFDVNPERIVAADTIKKVGLLPPGQVLSIPNTLGDTSANQPVLPDSEVVYSPSVSDFSVEEFVSSTGGYLSRFDEHVYDEWLTGAEIVGQVAVETSVNPRLLLAVLEDQSGWVLGEPSGPADKNYPLGLHVSGKKGLYQELVITATQINKGYYSGRSGVVTELKFKDKSRLRINPELNAGSMGVQLLYALFTYPSGWQESLYGSGGFLELYERMFPGSWERAAQVEPLLPADLEQPQWELPFSEGERWSLTGGPHYSWNAFSPRGALDFAPVTGEMACEVSKRRVTASAAGYVARSANNVLAIDLDGDTFEGSGWNIVYLHLANEGQTPAGIRVETDDRLGHPSCQRGHNTGTHVHIARKYNGEWLPADGSVPFILSGWEVYAEEGNYIGGMTKGDQIVEAKPYGPHSSIVVR